MPSPNLDQLANITPEQQAFLYKLDATTSLVMSAAYAVNGAQATEVFGSGLLQAERRAAFAGKLFEYALAADTTGQAMVDTSTIADAMLELAPSNFSAGSRRQKVAERALQQWFDPEYKGHRTIGASLTSVIDRHHRQVAQKIAMLKNERLRSENEPPTLLLTTEQGYGLYELGTKKHLEEESDVTGHCVGTASAYFERLRKGESRYFSLRSPEDQADDVFLRTTIEYGVKDHKILQMGGKKNASITRTSPHATSMAEAMSHILGKPVEVSQLPPEKTAASRWITTHHRLLRNTVLATWALSTIGGGFLGFELGTAAEHSNNEHAASAAQSAQTCLARVQAETTAGNTTLTLALDSLSKTEAIACGFVFYQTPSNTVAQPTGLEAGLLDGNVVNTTQTVHYTVKLPSAERLKKYIYDNEANARDFDDARGVEAASLGSFLGVVGGLVMAVGEVVAIDKIREYRPRR